MSDVPGYADFTHEIFPRLTNRNRGHILIISQSNFIQILNLCWSLTRDAWNLKFVNVLSFFVQ